MIFVCSRRGTLPSNRSSYFVQPFIERLADNVAVVLMLMCLLNAADAQTGKFVSSGSSVANRYIVVLNDDFPALRDDANLAADQLTSAYGGNPDKIFHRALKGFSTVMDRKQAALLSHDPRVKFIEEDRAISLAGVESGADWGLDRVDQRSLPLDGTYNFTASGAGVNAYIIDSGIRTTHIEFGGRAVSVYDNVGDGNGWTDCNGHGTHIAGTIGGSNYGIAKNVSLNSVRVLDCAGNGSISNLIAAVDWITANRIDPAVANISIGAGGSSPALETAISNSIASGVTYVIAAGNSATDACGSTPARIPEAITVAATSDLDTRAPFSNYGNCVDIFAPGFAITSASNLSDIGYRVMSGTSMAAPHVAGVVALYLESHTQASPASIAVALSESATPSLVADAAQTSNLLLFSFVDQPSACSGNQYFGSMVTTGGINYYPNSDGFSGRKGIYQAMLTVPGGAGYEFALESRKGSHWETLAVSAENNSINIVVTRPGTLRWRIRATTGGGNYDLCSSIP